MHSGQRIPERRGRLLECGSGGIKVDSEEVKRILKQHDASKEAQNSKRASNWHNL